MTFEFRCLPTGQIFSGMFKLFQFFFVLILLEVYQSHSNQTSAKSCNPCMTFYRIYSCCIPIHSPSVRSIIQNDFCFITHMLRRLKSTQSQRIIFVWEPEVLVNANTNGCYSHNTLCFYGAFSSQVQKNKSARA